MQNNFKFYEITKSFNVFHADYGFNNHRFKVYYIFLNKKKSL